MKPAFALSLSFEGISLLHRCAGGWRNAGEVALDAPDLSAALSGLRGAAARLDPGPLFTKLIIPNDQIRYLSVETGAANAGERDAMVRTALEGATPYAVSELAYDISVEGDTTHIAAVARETLAEAEGFAAEHQFGPLCFVAIPGQKPFLGEPYFGPTEYARTHLPPNERVEADGVAVVVIGPAEFPVHDAPPPAAPISPAERPDEPPKDEPAQAAPAVQPSAQAPAPPVSEAVATFSSRRRRTAPPTAKSVEPAPNPEAAAPSLDAPAPVEPPSTLIQDTVPEMPPEQVVSAPTNPPEPATAAPEPLATRRVEAPAATLAAPQRATPSSEPEAAPSRLGGLLRRRKPAAEAEAAPPTPPAAPQPRPIDVSGMPPRLAAAVLKTSDDDAPPETGFTPQPIAAAAVAAMPDETDRMTVFGARQPNVARSRPRFLGLILTAVLLLFLAGVAAWASIFLDDDVVRLFNRNPAPVVAKSESPAPSGPAPTTTAAAFSLPMLPTPSISNDQALSTPIQPEQPVTLASLDPATGLAGVDPTVLNDLNAPRTPAVSLQDSETAKDHEKRYAVTGIWSEAPPEPDTPSVIGLDDLFIGSIDNRDLSQDAVALLSPDSYITDAAYASQSSPAPAGTTFDLDERGLVRATPDGALSPDGHIVYLGRPNLTPPATPDRSAIEVEPEETLQDRLAGFRPRARPNDLSERAEREQLGGLTRDELAQVRPKLRPASIQQAALQEAEADGEAAESETETAEGEAEEDPFATATARAVAQVQRPKTRPSNFTSRVEKQRANPSNAVAIAAIAPRTVTPKIPSNASVSRSATLKNAINLRQVNLIGVYGTPSNRRALVRLPSGRYKKVQVGDTVDGGRVSAIGDSELRYQKGGRNLVLKIPSG
ncbi:MAG: hypothetical protein AB3N23_15920 [Paracoccaceae bacterium]